MALAHHAGGLRAARVRHARAGRSLALRGRPIGRPAFHRAGNKGVSCHRILVNLYEHPRREPRFTVGVLWGDKQHRYDRSVPHNGVERLVASDEFHGVPVLVAAKLADVVLVPCRPSILDIESTAVSVQRLQAATAAPVVVVLNGCAHRGREADEAAEALGGLGAQVCPARIGQRVLFARSLLDGRAAQEVEPGGKAADDVLRVHTFCLRTMKGRSR